MTPALDLLANIGEWIKADSLLKGTLLSLQNERDADGNLVEVSSSACIQAYDEFTQTTGDLEASQMMALYTAAR